VTPRRLVLVAVSLLAAARTAAAGDAESTARAARAVVGRVFAEPEFSPLSRADKISIPVDLDSSWLRRIAHWIADALRSVLEGLASLLRWLFGGFGRMFGGAGSGGEHSGDTARIVGWSLAIAAVALVAWLIVRLVRSSAAERRARAAVVPFTGDDEGDDALARRPDEWRRAAQELAGGGRRRESIRALYLSLLAALHHAGAIDYDRTRTNTAYVRDVRPDHPAFSEFSSLTALFDVCWYGGREPSDDDLARATRQADDVLRAFRAETVHA